MWQVALFGMCRGVVPESHGDLSFTFEQLPQLTVFTLAFEMYGAILSLSFLLAIATSLLK